MMSGISIIFKKLILAFSVFITILKEWKGLEISLSRHGNIIFEF